MIYLITGLPGNGKTLYTIWHVRERQKKENRPVFYNGIPELQIAEWTEFKEPEKWSDLPDGSIIVIDEAQRVFRPRPGRGDPPAHVALLETHRHKGFDIYIITQHPALIDQNVRRLAGTHRHVQRTFGAQRAVIHEWGEVHLDCERNRRDSSKTQWKYPKDVYGVYKSAEVHTHKVQLPKQVWYLVACVVVLAALLVFLKTRVSERVSKPEPEEAELITTPGAPGASPSMIPSPALAMSAREKEKPMTSVEYIESLRPRIDGHVHTASRYDEVTKPVQAPIIAGCIAMGPKCTCYTQQGTRYPATEQQCKMVVAGGRPFYDFVLPSGQLGQPGQPLPGPAGSVPDAAGTGSGTPGNVISSNTWGGVSARSGYQGVPPAL